LSGNVWKDADFIKQYLVVRDKIRQTHPDFDFRVIISDWRGAAPQGIEQAAARVVAARKEYPEFIIGYDLVGRETSDEKSVRFVDVFMKLRTIAAQEQVDLPLFFHDGETDWADNDDVVDALLMGSRRIGHGFNVYAYPYVERQLRSHKVALEVCPISNQILRYVNDLRIHPACGYVRRGVPCVLCSDDPFIFQNDGLSYDFWMAWTAWGLSLQDLKTLARNSLEYSTLAPELRTAALARWQKKWDSFTHNLAEQAGRDADFQKSLAKPANP
jgi:adenosine deaminase CECR1